MRVARETSFENQMKHMHNDMLSAISHLQYACSLPGQCMYYKCH